MPYAVSYNDGANAHAVGTYETIAEAYKAARNTYPEMSIPATNNRWHVMMYAYVKQLIEEMGDMKDSIKVAYQEPTPNPEDDVISVYICPQ
jgi:hypothetical protein